MKSLITYLVEALTGKQQTVYILVGLPGAGKSTWVKENLPNKTKVVSRDIIRSEMGLSDSVDDKVVGDYKQERIVTDKEMALIDKYLRFGRDFAIDDTNVIPKYRRKLINTLRDHDCKIVGVNLRTDKETCIKRREGQVPPEVIEKMAGKLKFLTTDDVDEIIDVE